MGNELGGAVSASGSAFGGAHDGLFELLLDGVQGRENLIGASSARITHHESLAAEEAARAAQRTPATPESGRNALTADLNGDGFVTMDEIIAMRRAGLSDRTLLERLRATGQIFEITPQQQQYLRSQGISDSVLRNLQELNADVRDRLLNGQIGGIRRPPGQ